MKNNIKTTILASTITFSTLLTSCGVQQQPDSQIKVTDVQHSSVKEQTIGNCWIYAMAGWIESLHLKATDQQVDLSESYWTYWHFYNELIFLPDPNNFNTGGNFDMFKDIAMEYGYMLQGDFIEAEREDIHSRAQRNAESFVEKSLQEGGKLHQQSDRTHENIIEVLDEAFGVNMQEARLKAKKLSNLATTDGLGSEQSVIQDLDQWHSVRFPRVYGDTGPSDSLLTQRRMLMKRVMRALNDKQPVIISTMVGFNAFEDGVFDLDNLGEDRNVGEGGGHLLLLEDYTVKNVPGVGSIGEGDVSDELKELALEGDVDTLVTKNSWGTSPTDGYHRFTMDYLSTKLDWGDGSYEALRRIYLPPGY